MAAQTVYLTRSMVEPMSSVLEMRRVSVLKRSSRYSAEESFDWLYAKMNLLGIGTLDDLAELTGIDKGTLSRYFRQERRPSIDVVAPLSTALQVSVETLLRALGALDRKRV